MRASQLAVLVLAAGAGSRFAAATPDDSPHSKLLASLGGRAILQRVLDTANELRPATTIVVLGRGPAADAVEATIDWRHEQRVRNAHAERGLATSLQVGLGELSRTGFAAIDAVLILLGDQPLVRVRVMHALLRAAGAHQDFPITAPRYSRGGGPNPLLVRRSAWSLAATLEGDRGFGPLLRARPELVYEVPVAGRNPDVDTPEDLARLSRA